MTLILNRSMNLRHYLPDLRDLPVRNRKHR
jgi:hypothetical protein